ncbi:PaaI family thioesterase [Erythrobacter sp. GH1-10]|uniref:PaaI family thioesterase n=1 Tax=Erythrobacter sp. GH1-10 TaxID=3349334 RepID=UPI003878183F
MNLIKMTGLELMQMGANLPGNMGDRGIASVIPMKITEAEQGRVSFTARADERHTNPMGAIHGGFAATVLDAATGCAVHTLLPAGIGFGTVDLNVKMVRPVPINEELFAVGEVIDRTRTSAISQAMLKDGDGKIYAHATATCRILGRA